MTQLDHVYPQKQRLHMQIFNEYKKKIEIPLKLMYEKSLKRAELPTD